MNGQDLLSAGFFGVVTAWLSQSFTVKWSETAHTGSVTTLASNDKMVLTGGIDGEVQMMNLGTGARIDHAFTKVETIWKVAFTPDRAVVCGREDGVATVWMVPFPEVLRLVKARAFEPLENNFMKNT
jgi:WD40 repeat protein